MSLICCFIFQYHYSIWIRFWLLLRFLSTSQLAANSIESLLYHATAEELDPLFDKIKLPQTARERSREIFQNVFSSGIFSSDPKVKKFCFFFHLASFFVLFYLLEFFHFCSEYSFCFFLVFLLKSFWMKHPIAVCQRKDENVLERWWDGFVSPWLKVQIICVVSQVGHFFFFFCSACFTRVGCEWVPGYMQWTILYIAFVMYLKFHDRVFKLFWVESRLRCK